MGRIYHRVSHSLDGSTLLSLTSLIGRLTECESNQPEFDWSRDQKYPERRFRASLEIQSLSWLKNIAAEKIEAELRERDLRARKMSNPFASRSSITLKHIYVNTTMKIKVTIDATRSQAAVYSLSKSELSPHF